MLGRVAYCWCLLNPPVYAPMLLLLLQVQSGAGRSGMWWAHGQFDGGAMQPDMVVFAKGIASGYPLAGVVMKRRVTG